MSPATSVTFDKLRWWIVAAALAAGVISAAGISTDVAATDVQADEAAASAPTER